MYDLRQKNAIPDNNQTTVLAILVVLLFVILNTLQQIVSNIQYLLSTSIKDYNRMGARASMQQQQQETHI
jgi:hypothetical protein